MRRGGMPGLAAGAGALSLLFAAVAAGHVDDLKESDRMPRYEGPGYRAAADRGALPLEFDFSGIRLLSWLPLPEFGSFGRANDCWGYVAGSGREYAIIGLDAATAFVEVTNPASPQIVAVLGGPPSTWRDVKVYQQYAYAVTEGAGAGIQIFDMTNIDGGIVTLANTVNTGGETDTHNVVIDTDAGMLYRTGGQDVSGGAGLRMYSLANPTSPAFMGEWSERYVHDAQVVTWTDAPYQGRQLAFCCSGFNGGWVETGLDILDVTDPQNVVQIARYLYPAGQYSHQGWLSSDRQYFYLNDELDEQNNGVLTNSHVIDISTLTAPVQVSTFSSGSSSIDHNLYVSGNLIFEANYRSGLRVFDATNPVSPVEIAYFDTFPGSDAASFNGLWSNYPFFPSGTIIGSDIEKGLFVWRLGDAGIAFDFPSGLPANIPPSGGTVDVNIIELEAGALVPGTATLHVADGAGFAAIPMASAGGSLYTAAFPATDCPGYVDYYFSASDISGLPVTSPVGAPTLVYEVASASAVTTVFSNDMETAAGWSVQNDPALEDGGWNRGAPAGAGDRGDPVTDFDGSGQCWLTDNVAGNSDVDGGPTRLVSAAIDLTGIDEPWIRYARWYTSNGGDVMEIEISNNDGASWVPVETVGNGFDWSVHTFAVSDFVAPTAVVRMRFTASDVPNDSVVEAGIDALSVLSLECGETLLGDLTGPAGAPDGVVDALDFLMLIGQWGTPCTGSCEADITGPAGPGFPDGAVDALDFLLLIANWS